MYTTNLLTKLLVALAFALPLACHAQKNVETLPPPLIAPTAAGEEYYPHLQKIEIFLNEKKTMDFYYEISSLYGKARANQKIRRLEGRPISEKAEIATWEWLGYYLARAPLFPDKPKYREGVAFPFLNFDISIKKIAYLKILTENVEKKAKFFDVESKKLNALHLRYLQAYLKSFAEARDEWQILAWKKKNEDEKEIEKMRQTPEAEEGSLEYAAALKTAHNRKNANASARLARSDALAAIIKYRTNIWAKRLIDSYPCDGASVRKNILDAGFSKEQCHKLLLESVEERNKETEYLFTDLPKLTPRARRAATPPKK
jgi:hypothetical protein